MAVSPPAAPVPVFAALGLGGWGPGQELRARPELRLVGTPRHAAVLLVAGRIVAEHAEALDRVHDQVPRPRAVVAWSGGGRVDAAGTVVHGGADDVTAAILDASGRVVGDPSASSPDRLPDVEPNEWRGVGPFGQGGEGMMGGTPYGRPMAMTGDDRDGLALDQLHLRLGPFLEWLPPAVALDVTIQGEVLQDVTPRVCGQGPGDLGSEVPDPARARRGRAGLRRLALALRVHGLDALSVRAARLAADGGDLRRPVEALRRSIRRSGLLWSVTGVGSIDGLGDAAARWRDRLERLAREVAGGEAAPDRPPSVGWAELAPALRGMTVTDAVTTVVSLHDHLTVADRDRAGP